MCDINEKTKFKTKTIYKVVEKHNDKYYSVFAAKEISVGKVSPLTPEEVIENLEIMGWSYVDPREYTHPVSPKFNDNMVGKTSGFAKIGPAKALQMGNEKEVVLKMVIGGDIMKGTSANIAGLDPNYITYAGTEILSMEEV
jgi:hypothetical protein